MEAPSPEMFKARLDEAPSNLVEWEVSLPTARGSELDGFQAPFQPKLFCDSVSQRV